MSDSTGLIKCSSFYEILQIMVGSCAFSIHFVIAFQVLLDYPTGMFSHVFYANSVFHSVLTCLLCLPQSSMQAIHFQLLQAPPFIINFAGDLKYGMQINSE